MIEKYKRFGMIYTNSFIFICKILILFIRNPETNQIENIPWGPGDVFNLICFRISYKKYKDFTYKYKGICIYHAKSLIFLYHPNHPGLTSRPAHIYIYTY